MYHNPDLKLVSPSGAFEFVDPCYVPKCDREADLLTSGGPMCRRCYVKMMIATFCGAAYEYRAAGWAPYQFVEDTRKSIIKYETELAGLEPNVPSVLPRFEEQAKIITDYQMERIER